MKKEFVRMAIEKKSEPGVEPRTAEQLQIRKGRFEIKRRKHSQRLVEFFDASTVIEEE